MGWESTECEVFSDSKDIEKQYIGIASTADISQQGKCMQRTFRSAHEHITCLAEHYQPNRIRIVEGLTTGWRFTIPGSLRASPVS